MGTPDLHPTIGPTPSSLRAEPFRLFFPLALVLGVAGVAHWILYTLPKLRRAGRAGAWAGGAMRSSC